MTWCLVGAFSSPVATAEFSKFAGILRIAPSLSPKPQSWPPGRGRHSQAPQKGGGSSDFQALPRPAPCFLVVGIGNSVPLLPLLPLPSRLVQGGVQPPSALVLSWVGTDKLCWDAVGSSSLQPLSSSDRCQPAASPSSTPSAVGFSQGPEGFTLSHPLACEHVFLRSGVSKLFSVKLLSRVRLFATPWFAAYQAPPSMGFSPGLPSQAVAWPPRLSAGRRGSGSQGPWLGGSERPIFHSSCKGKLGVALESLQGQRDLI